MLAKLDKFGVESSDITELGGAELGKVRLRAESACRAPQAFGIGTHINVEPQDGILLACSFKTRDLRLELVLLLLLLLLLLSLWPRSVVSLRLLA